MMDIDQSPEENQVLVANRGTKRTMLITNMVEVFKQEI